MIASNGIGMGVACGPTSISGSMWKWHCEIYETKCTTNVLDYLAFNGKAPRSGWTGKSGTGHHLMVERTDKFENGYREVRGW